MIDNYITITNLFGEEIPVRNIYCVGRNYISHAKEFIKTEISLCNLSSKDFNSSRLAKLTSSSLKSNSSSIKALN